MTRRVKCKYNLSYVAIERGSVNLTAKNVMESRV